MEGLLVGGSSGWKAFWVRGLLGEESSGWRVFWVRGLLCGGEVAQLTCFSVAGAAGGGAGSGDTDRGCEASCPWEL